MPVLLAGLSGAALAQTPPVATKVFNPTTVALGGTSTITFDVSNVDPAVTLTGVGFTDNLPSGLVIASPSNISGFCTGGSAGVATGSSGGTTTSLLNTTLVPNSHCTYSIDVRATTIGTKINSTGPVASSAGPGAAATATLTVTGSSPTLTKAFGAATIPVFSNTTLTFTVTNPNGAGGTLTGLAFTDTLPPGLQLATPNGLTGSCGGGTITAVAGSNNMSLSGATLAAGASCTFAVNVAGTTVGAKVNVTSTIASNEAPAGAVATASITVATGTSATSLSSSQNPSTFGQAVTFTATVTASGGTPTGNVTFRDGAAVLGTVALAGSVATLTTSALATGSHPITATYNGDASFTASTSPVVNQGVGQVATTTTLSSSQNPSEFGKPVTFTATVSGGPTGTITFFDGATSIGTGALAGGVATLTTSSLTIGSHSITAAFGGNANFTASTSTALLQTVSTPADSLKLRQLQVQVSKMEAQSSGQAISGAIDGAIGEGFAEQGQLVTMGGNGLRINFAAEPGQQADSGAAARSSGSPFGSLTEDASAAGPRRAFAPERAPERVDDAFAALGYMATKAPPPPPRAEPKTWLVWADIRGTNFSIDASRDVFGGLTRSDVSGGQVNALAGITRRVTPDLLVGLLGGYEHFNYSSDSLNGRLKGDGWTVGGYLGWRLMTGIRLDLGSTYSGVNYNGFAGTASGSFPGSRWLVTAGLTGNYRLQQVEIEPSARVFALWEKENAYVDSLGTAQADRNFSTGRASAGVKVLIPWYVNPNVKVSPYAGIYADYYFSNDNAVGLLLPTTFIDGWSGRVVGGVNATMANGASVGVGAEYGGLGNNFSAWTLRGRAGVPFAAQ